MPFQSVNIRPISDSSNMEVFKKISQLVSRDKRTFGRISPSDHTLSISIEGPARSWASPETSYRYPTAIPERSCPSVPHPTNGFQETISFRFDPIAPVYSDETCEAGKLFLNYQKSIIYDEGCCSMHTASWPDDLQRLDLLISGLSLSIRQHELQSLIAFLTKDWKSSGSASSFHSSASEIEHIAALSPHLSSPPDPLRSSGFPFQQFGTETGDNWAEMVDFVLPADASDVDRKALEWFIANFIRWSSILPFSPYPLLLTPHTFFSLPASNMPCHRPLARESIQADCPYQHDVSHRNVHTACQRPTSRLDRPSHKIPDPPLQIYRSHC